MTLSKLKASGYMESYHDPDYKRVVQEAISKSAEDPYAVASLLGRYLQPVLKYAQSIKDYDSVCWICDVFRRIKVEVFPLEEPPICSADCEIGQLKVLYKAGVKDAGIRKSEDLGIPEELSGKDTKGV